MLETGVLFDLCRDYHLERISFEELTARVVAINPPDPPLKGDSAAQRMIDDDQPAFTVGTTAELRVALIHGHLDQDEYFALLDALSAD